MVKSAFRESSYFPERKRNKHKRDWQEYFSGTPFQTNSLGERYFLSKLPVIYKENVGNDEKLSPKSK